MRLVSVQIPYKIINDSLWAKLACFPYKVMWFWFKNVISLLSFSLLEKTGCFGAQTGVMGNVVWKNVFQKKKGKVDIGLKPSVSLNLMLFNMHILLYSWFICSLIMLFFLSRTFVTIPHQQFIKCIQIQLITKTILLKSWKSVCESFSLVIMTLWRFSAANYHSDMTWRQRI